MTWQTVERLGKTAMSRTLGLWPIRPLNEWVATSLNYVSFMMSGMMSGMLQKLLQGMRVSMVVSVDGEVVETNASHPSGSHSNAFVLVDIPFDSILADPKAAALMTKPAPDPAQLADLDLPGLKIERADKTITVKFR